MLTPFLLMDASPLPPLAFVVSMTNLYLDFELVGLFWYHILRDNLYNIDEIFVALNVPVLVMEPF